MLFEGLAQVRDVHMSQMNIEPAYCYLNSDPELMGNATLVWYQRVVWS